MNGGYFILIILVLFVLWLVLVRPQRRRQKAREAMIDEIQVGDEVITAGGFYATVLEVADDELTVELSPGAQARLDKRAIAAVFRHEPEEPANLNAKEEPAVGEPTGQSRR
jgi:preprotein translocase subunit YajC